MHCFLILQAVFQKIHISSWSNWYVNLHQLFWHAFQVQFLAILVHCEKKVSYISLDELKRDSFLHLYCQHCEQKHFADILKKYPDKLPKEKSITNRFYNWDQLRRNHVDIDIPGCLVPYKPGKIVNNKMKNWFY